jgi:hypothetical protein
LFAAALVFWRPISESLTSTPPGIEIQLTALPELVTPQLVDLYERKTGNLVRLKSVSSPLEIWRRLERPNPDGMLELTTIFSWQTEAAGPLGRIRPLDVSRPRCARVRDLVAVDFRSLPGRPYGNGTWLFGWAVSGFWASPGSSWEAGFSLDRELKSARREVMLLPWAAELFWLAVRGQPLALLEEGETDEAESKALATTERSLKLLERQAEILGRTTLSPWFGRPDSLLPSEPLKGRRLLQGHHTNLLHEPFKSGWRFLLPEEKGHLWTVALAMRETLASAAEIEKMNDAACELIEFLAEQWSGAEWSTVFASLGLASTLRAHEGDNWPAPLRPAYLREFAMRSVEFRRPFAADAVVHDILMSEPNSKGE